jgi:hypothetical protein
MEKEQQSFIFDGSMSRMVLESYLSRSITMSHFLQSHGYVKDNLRLLQNIGAKFCGRALLHWGNEQHLVHSLTLAESIARKIHALDSQIILQAGIFEIVTQEVNEIKVPSWVFQAFEITPEPRCFRYSEMIYPDGLYHNHWQQGSSVPDITRMETKMWFLYLAGSYIKIGIEAIHFGQITLIGRHDAELINWWEILSRVRKFAAEHARRHFILCDAHVSSGLGCYGLTDEVNLASGGYKVGEHLLLDFHALPLRIKEIEGKPYEAELQVGHLDSLYGRSLGGISPSGWKCDSLPFLVDIDNWGSSGHGGESVAGKIGNMVGINDRYWIWGWDEICWFAHQKEAYRNEWLWYAWKWIKQSDPNGFLEMPGMRGLADPVGDINEYYANKKSIACPKGFNQEETIKAIWEQA